LKTTQCCWKKSKEIQINGIHPMFTDQKT
jgi:hypothetical protein